MINRNKYNDSKDLTNGDNTVCMLDLDGWMVVPRILVVEKKMDGQ